MQWLLQDWIWVALAVVGVFFMMRMGGRGMGHNSARREAGAHGDHAPGPGTGSAFDPVSHRAVATVDGAVSTLYRGRAYYFEGRENRDLFETDPAKYLAEAARVGQAPGNEYEHARGHRRHGC